MIHMLCMMTKTPTDPRRVCVQCNQLFVPRRVDQTACSKACRRKIHSPRHPALPRDKTCAICGKAFTDESLTNSVKTCSDSCRTALLRQTKNRLRGGPAVTRKQAAPVKLARAGTIDRRQMLIDAAKRVGLITEAGSREVEK
jgi:predicted nucleic acid-binding Zn ribbon protein